MDWDRLLSSRRLGKGSDEAEDRTRTAFQRDFDRIVFSSAFRRLQDKTQVFPLAQSDDVRTRLTHSLEASCVGRSLGTLVGQRLVEVGGPLRALQERDRFHPSDMGAIVGAACLAHDIGNPPFGHAGENAISHWFQVEPYGKEIIERLKAEGEAFGDFTRFEGNAQGFRVLARLQHPEHTGGMQLTHAALASFVKYPRASSVVETGTTAASAKKHGFFRGDAALFADVAEAVGLPRLRPDGLAYARHPLAFLVEAADDICYHVIDVEDGYRRGLLPFDETQALFLDVVGGDVDPARLRVRHERRASVIEYLRAKAISSLIGETVLAFVENHDAILAGTFDRALAAVIPQHAAFRCLVGVAAERVYPTREVVLIEAAGFSVLGQLIEMFMRTLDEKAGSGAQFTQKSKTLWKLFPRELLGEHRDDPGRLGLYGRVLAVTDFVSGLTDRHAVSLFKRLTGISLPGE